jgi:hypothetical protein
VVVRAEGLQTSFWRLQRAGIADELTWYSVDLPPVMASVGPRRLHAPQPTKHHAAGVRA